MLGLGKPVGVVISGDTVFVSDQAKNRIFKASLNALLASAQPVAPGSVVTEITSPDLLAVDSRGSLYTKCNTTGFCQITPNGAVKVLTNDFRDARGVAIDTSRNRLYVIDHVRPVGGVSYVRTFPLN